jgi:two-component system response regulator YesN
MHSLLIAEDEELFRRELAVATPWEDWGFVLVGAARDGLEALELVRERRPALLLTDLRMPRLDGLGLLEAIERELPEEDRPLVLVLSALQEFASARSALRHGALDYLLKPLDDAELGRAMLRAAGLLEERARLRAVAGAAEAAPAIAFLAAQAPSGSREPGDAYVERAIAEIRESYVADLSVEELGPRLGISGGHLARLFKARTGATFSEYLARYRVQRAVELLRDPTIRIGEVADLVGYRDQRHFSALFRRLVGLTPTEFREGRFPKR